MGFWKVLGVVAGGVAAVAIAPVAAPVLAAAGAAAAGALAAGAGAAATSATAAVVGVGLAAAETAGAAAVATAATAAAVDPLLVAGAASVAAGAVAVKRSDANARGSERQAAFEAGVSVANQRLEAQLAEIRDRLKDNLVFEKYLVALFAVGVAVANVDGNIDPAERVEIEEFVAGLAGARLPKAILQEIDALYRKPPTIDESFAYLKEADVDLSIVGDLIEAVIQADGIVTPEETAAKRQWIKYKVKLSMGGVA